MKRVFAVLLALCVLAGCTAEPMESVPPEESTPEVTVMPAAQELILPVYARESFHPISGAGNTNLTIAPLLYEGLFAREPDGSVTPVLCAEYTTSEDGMLWKFTLKENVLFSDGSVLTAAEVVSSLLLSQSAGSVYASRLTGATIFAEDGLVCILLASPRSGFCELLDIPIVSGSGNRPAGTGPYALVHTLSGAGLCLSRRPEWHGEGTLPLEMIPLRELGELDDLISAFDSGEISLVDTNLTAANALGFSGGYETVDYVTRQMLYVGFNLRRGVCTDANLRLAIAQSINREQLCQVQLARHAVATALPVVPGSRLAVGEEPNWSMAEAQTLLAAAGYTWQEETLFLGATQITLRMVASYDNSYHSAVAQAVAAGLEELGMTVELALVSFSDYEKALAAGQFDLYLALTKLSPDCNLSALIQGSLNFGGYSSGTTRGLLESYLETGEATRPAAHAALCEQLVADVPFTPIGFKCHSALSPWGRIAGLDPVEGNVFYGFSSWVLS